MQPGRVDSLRAVEEDPNARDLPAREVIDARRGEMTGAGGIADAAANRGRDGDAARSSAHRSLHEGEDAPRTDRLSAFDAQPKVGKGVFEVGEEASDRLAAFVRPLDGRPGSAQRDVLGAANEEAVDVALVDRRHQSFDNLNLVVRHRFPVSPLRAWTQ